jgi:transposase-like protein
MEDYSFPYCPHTGCRLHGLEPSQPYTEFIAWGTYSTKAFGEVPRFRCTACGHTFSTQTFRVDYYAKRIIDYSDLLARLVSTASLSALGRAIAASTDTISNRVSRASRQTLAFESRLSRTRHPSEDLAADGFESFCVSQFFPNNITILVGSESQFVYAADHATLRRKGRMTKGQKARRIELEGRFRADPRGIERSFTRIASESLRVLSDEGRAAIALWTDEHQAYPRGIAASPCAQALNKLGRLVHRTVSSRAARTRANPLFPVNYLDRELRKDLHEHVRESVCFGRNVNRQMERLSLYLFYHNFIKAHRTRWGPISNAVVAGYDAAQIATALVGLWTDRSMLTRTDLTECGEDSWRRARRTPLGPSHDYLPKYAVA